MSTRYAGSDWIRSALKRTDISPLGEAVADLLGEVFAGIYHLDNQKLARVDWADPYVIVVFVSHCSLSTFDNDHLTRLVVLSHDRMLRVNIDAKSARVLELMFHQRKTRDGSIMERMPTMEQHLADIRKYFPGT